MKKSGNAQQKMLGCEPLFLFIPDSFEDLFLNSFRGSGAKSCVTFIDACAEGVSAYQRGIEFRGIDMNSALIGDESGVLFKLDKKWNFGLWAVILKETDVMIGQCGLTMQPWKDEEVLEIGYLFEQSYWHKGYAIEAAKECKKYAFEVLKADEVCSIIRDTNIASQKVAIRNGMTMTDTWTKHYRGVDMPHYRYVVYFGNNL